MYRESKYIELTIVFDEATPERLAAEQQDTQDSQSNNAQGIPGGGDYSDFFREFFGGLPFGR